MGRPPSKVDAELEASLRRIGGALEHNRNLYAGMVDQVMASPDAAVAGRIGARTEEAARVVERHRRRAARDQRRREEAGGDDADVPRGIVFAVVAITCLMFAFLRPQFFWMIFVALGFGMSAASAFGRAARRRRLEEAQPNGQRETSSNASATGASEAEDAATAQPPGEPLDPKVARIQDLCDKLLAELESGPPIVREVVTEPRATIGGLRQACLETARRERELRTVLAAQDEAGLVAERETLVARLSNEHDAIVRDRLGQALAALEQQLVHRAELTTAATRLEAENTRILYTLENVRMQLLRARSTDMGAPELGGKLRDSLRDLGTQIDAVAEALEWASAPVAADSGTAPARAPEAQAAPDTSATRSEVERAEREAAARRAARAREAQRP